MFQENVRCLAAAVMAADPAGRFPAQKVGAILAALDDVAKMPHASKVHWPGSYTYAESSYHHYLSCLSDMPGADEALREAAGRATALSRDFLSIARPARRRHRPQGVASHPRRPAGGDAAGLDGARPGGDWHPRRSANPEEGSRFRPLGTRPRRRRRATGPEKCVFPRPRSREAISRIESRLRTPP